MLCPRCLRETQVPYEHQLQDGWNCTGVTVQDREYHGDMICTNCGDPATFEWSHKRDGEFTCNPPVGVGKVSEGERRILNAIGNQNATDSVLWLLTEMRKSFSAELSATHKNMQDLRKQLSSTSVEDIKYLHVEMNRLVDQRDAALAEVEFLKIKVEELEARKEGCQRG